MSRGYASSKPADQLRPPPAGPAPGARPMDDDLWWMCASDLRREVIRLRALRDLVLAHATSPAVPHSPAWDDQLEDIYKAAEGLP